MLLLWQEWLFRFFRLSAAPIISSRQGLQNLAGLRRSRTLPINLASLRVMEKLGFRCERDFQFAGLGHRLCRLVAGDWRGYHGGVRWEEKP